MSPSGSLSPGRCVVAKGRKKDIQPQDAQPNANHIRASSISMGKELLLRREVYDHSLALKRGYAVGLAVFL